MLKEVIKLICALLIVFTSIGGLGVWATLRVGSAKRPDQPGAWSEVLWGLTYS